MRFARVLAAGLGAALSLVLVIAPFSGAGPPSATLAETTITIQKGIFGDSDDTFLYQYDPDNGDAWSVSTFRVGYSHPNEHGIYHGLLRFDLSPIPPGAEIRQAKLELYCDGWSGGGADVSMAAYVVLRDTNVRQATWNRARLDHPWGEPGCNHVGSDRTAEAESVNTVNVPQRWVEFDLTNAVQDWVGGMLDNNGLLLRAEGGTGFFAFSSCDGFDVSRRPKLVITYSYGTRTPTLTETVTRIPSATAPASATPAPTASPTATVVNAATPSPTPSSSPTEATVILQQGTDGYSGCTDTDIYEGTPDTNYCREERLQVGSRQQRAALLHFDLAPIPADARIAQASLQLYAIGWSGADASVEAYVLARPFDACQATWNQAGSGNPWGEPGCNGVTDRRTSPEASVTTSGAYRWYGFELTAAVQGWLSGDVPNYGLLLRGSSTLSGEPPFFASAEEGTIGIRPRLVITYRAPNVATSTPALSATATPTTSRTPVVPATHTSTPTPTSSPTSVSTATPTSSPTPTPARLTLGHITDANIGLSWIESQRLPLVVSAVNREAEVMVDTGNCTEHGSATEFRQYVELMTNSATIPWRAVVGTKDTPHLFAQYIGPLEWSWDVGGYRLIGINTQAINYEVLDQALTTEKPCILFGNLPLDHLGPLDQSELRLRFILYDIPLYVAGYVRYNSLQTDYPSGTVLVTGSRVVRCHYRVITLRGFEVEDVQFKQACR